MFKQLSDTRKVGAITFGLQPKSLVANGSVEKITGTGLSTLEVIVNVALHTIGVDKQGASVMVHVTVAEPPQRGGALAMLKLLVIITLQPPAGLILRVSAANQAWNAVPTAAWLPKSQELMVWFWGAVEVTVGTMVNTWFTVLEMFPHLSVTL